MDKTYILKCIKSDYTSHMGFAYPRDVGATVAAPDWDSSPVCGGGIHGWLHGVGNIHSCDYINDEGVIWLVLIADTPVIDLGGKVKFPSATIAHIGDMQSAVAFLLAHDPLSVGQPVIGASVTSGDEGTSISGDRGTSTSGEGGTSTSGHYGTSTSGYKGISTSGEGGTSASGYYGTSTSGHYGTSTSGYKGTSASGDGGTSISGEGGILQIEYHDRAAGRYRRAVAYVGRSEEH